MYKTTNLQQYVLKNKSLKTLQKFTELLLGVGLAKASHIRRSDWTAKVLSDEQLYYASVDAVASLKVYEALLLLPKPNTRINDGIDTASLVGKTVDVMNRGNSYCCKGEVKQIHENYITVTSNFKDVSLQGMSTILDFPVYVNHEFKYTLQELNISYLEGDFGDRDSEKFEIKVKRKNLRLHIPEFQPATTETLETVLQNVPENLLIALSRIKLDHFHALSRAVVSAGHPAKFKFYRDLATKVFLLYCEKDMEDLDRVLKDKNSNLYKRFGSKSAQVKHIYVGV